MIKNVDIKNKVELRLIILLFEEIFIEQNEFKAYENNELNQYLNLFTKVTIPKGIETDSDYVVLQKCFSKCDFVSETEIYLLYKLMRYKKKPSLFYKSIELIFFAKDEYFMKNKNIIIEDDNYYNFVYQVIQLFNYDNKNDDSKIYTFDFKEKKLIKREANNQEIEEYYNREKEFNLKDIRNFIKKAKYTERKILSNKIINDNINNNMESQNDIQKEQINKVNAELNVLKLANSKLENEIVLLKISLQESNNKMEEMIKKHNDDIENLKKKGENDLNEQNNRHNIAINKLKTELAYIKSENNSLKNSIENISNKNQTMKSEKAINEMKNMKDINELNNKLNNSETQKERYKFEIGLVKSRDSSKYIIDFLYAILTKKINLSLKYESKVEFVCEKIRKESNKEHAKFVSILCEFLNHLFKEKTKGDNIAHPNYFEIDILNGNKNVYNFFIYFLEVKKYFNDFRALYFSKNENEKESNIKIIQQNCDSIDLFTCLEDFALKNKLISK